MKTKLIILAIILFAINVSSCTPEVLNENLDNPQACCTENEEILPPPPPPPAEGD
jgi:hypothetical protein